MEITTSQVIFYFFAAAIVIFSFLTVTSKRILRAATFLFFVLLSVSGMYFLLNYQFLGAVQITIYAGGIIILIIFSILLTSHIGEKLPPISRFKFWASLIASGAGMALTIWVILSTNFGQIASAPAVFNMHSIGKALLSYKKGGYVLPFEIISILLLAAMVGAIVIARREPVKENINSKNAKK